MHLPGALDVIAVQIHRGRRDRRMAQVIAHGGQFGAAILAEADDERRLRVPARWRDRLLPQKEVSGKDAAATLHPYPTIPNSHNASACPLRRERLPRLALQTTLPLQSHAIG